MRTNIDIDDDLMRAAMEVAGSKTKRETVEIALKSFVEREVAYRELMKLRGTVKWEGNLDEMRRDRPHAKGDW